MRATRAVAWVACAAPAYLFGTAFGPPRSRQTFSGVLRGAIVRRLVLDVPDPPGRHLGLGETQGRHESTGDVPFMPGATVRTVELWGRGAPGSDEGVMSLALGADTVVARYEGGSQPADGGRLRLTGTFRFVRGTGRFSGITGQATYDGILESPSYELAWHGAYELPASPTR